MNYWEECITGALKEAGLNASKEQIDIIIGWVEFDFIKFIEDEENSGVKKRKLHL